MALILFYMNNNFIVKYVCKLIKNTILLTSLDIYIYANQREGNYSSIFWKKTWGSREKSEVAGFFVFFTVAVLLFHAPSGGSNPAGPFF